MRIQKKREIQKIPKNDTSKRNKFRIQKTIKKVLKGN